MKKIFVILILFFNLLFSFSSAYAINVKGQLFEKGTKKPLKAFNIFLLPQKLKATTDDKGNFQFTEVEGNQFQLVVNQTGFLKLKQSFSEVTEAEEIILYLEKENYSQFESTVYSRKKKRDQSTKTMTQEQFLNVPGAGGDPVKAIQNLPGVNRVAGFSSQVVIQGSAPKDTKYSIDGHEIPLAFHFGGLTSVITPESISEVDYLSAGYGSEFGRAIGGVINLKTRDPNNDPDVTQKGFVFFDTTKTGGLLEKRIDENSSVLVSGRYSYIGFFLSKVLEGNEQLDLTVAPEYSDLNVTYKSKLSDKSDFKLVSVLSRDTLGFLFKEPNRDDPSVRGKFNNETYFWRIIPQFVYKIDEDTEIEFSTGIGENKISIEIGDYFFNLKNYILTVRGEWQKKLNSNWVTQIGFDNQYGASQVELKLPVFRTSGGVNNPIGASEVRQVSLNARGSNTALYFRSEYVSDDKSFSAVPALRVDQFKYLTKEAFADPRISAEYSLSEFFKFKSAAGIYHQVPEPPERDRSFGNPEIRAPKAIHALLGFEKDFKEGSSRGYSWGVSGFDRWYEKLVIQSSKYVERDGVIQPEIYNNNGAGRSYGVESLVKFDFEPINGWFSYTWSKSVRWDDVVSVYNFEYDQTHNLNLVISYKLPSNWMISSRLRYVTGNPYTPVVSASFDANNDVYIPKRGPIYSERMRDFNQLDLRIDKKWIGNQSISSMYIDIQNVLNQANPESIRYAYDYSTSQTVDGLPLLAAIGIKMEF
jgi:outer membrane cobalamin receptor